MKRWWTKKYNLPSNHKLFVSQTIAELNLEFYEDLLVRRKEIMEDLDDPEIKSEAKDIMFKQLNSINNALGFEAMSSDPLIDEWERDLEMGRIPDLEKR